MFIKVPNLSEFSIDDAEEDFLDIFLDISISTLRVLPNIFLISFNSNTISELLGTTVVSLLRGISVFCASVLISVLGSNLTLLFNGGVGIFLIWDNWSNKVLFKFVTGIAFDWTLVKLSVKLLFK